MQSEVFRFAESEVSARAEVKNASPSGRGGARKRDGEGKKQKENLIGIGCERYALSPDSVGSSPKGRAGYVVERLDTK